MSNSPTVLRRRLHLGGRALAVAAVGALVAFPIAAHASGDNGGRTPVPPGSVTAAAVPADTHVALFFDPTYVDTSTGGDGEATNLEQTLTDQGFTVTTFTGITTADWTTAIAGAQVIAVPELEHSETLGADLEPGALAALQTFISNGGRLTTYVDSAFNFMETVLGIPQDQLDGDQDCPCTKTAAATGTEWESGPTTLDDNNATDTLDITTAPAGSKVIYADDDDANEAGLAYIPLGQGSIVYFGWDWFFDSEETDQFANWFSVPAESISAVVPVTPVTPVEPIVPEPVTIAPMFTG